MKTLILAAFTALVSAAFAPAGAANAASIMVFAPHPDDELLIAAGILRRAVSAGDAARVVVVTNGDAFGKSRTKKAQAESVAGLALLGVPEEHLIFLGYGDQLTLRLFNQQARPDEVLQSDAKMRETYGFSGLGRADYHRYRHGQPAAYTRRNLLNDLVDVIATYRPTDLYTMIPEDAHPDHQGTSRFVSEALGIVRARFAEYRPRLHLSVVHGSAEDRVAWPGEVNRPDLPFAKPPFLGRTAWKWEDVRKYPVPPEMAVMDPKRNLKSLAITQHKSKNRHDPFLFRFVRADEFFWTVPETP